MLKFYPLQVSDIRQETEDCVSIALQIPSDFRQIFQFQPGQYLSFRQMIGGEEVRRSYSICSSPTEGELRVAIKKVKGGKFSTFANEQLAVGDILEVMPPLGKFTTQVNVTNNKHYLAFAAGSGITPILSILKTVLEEEPKSQFTLIYGNRSIDSIIFKEEIEALKNKHLEQLSVHHILSGDKRNAPLFSGRINAQKCQQFFNKLIDPNQVDEYFICGPEAMMLEIRETLLAFDVSPKKIHIELFTTAAAKKRKSNNINTSTTNQPKTVSDLRIKLDGNAFDLSIPMNVTSILDTGSASGLDLPYACKGGVCCTCKAKLIEGKVEMEVNYGLEPEELEAGYILTCQAYPRSKKIVVDYDV